MRVIHLSPRRQPLGAIVFALLIATTAIGCAPAPATSSLGPLAASAAADERADHIARSCAPGLSEHTSAALSAILSRTDGRLGAWSRGESESAIRADSTRPAADKAGAYNRYVSCVESTVASAVSKS